MIQQHVHTNKPSAGLGILIILGFFAGFMAVSVILGLLIEKTGITQLSYLVIVFAIVAGIWLMRKYILEYRFTVNEGTIYFERLYGKQNRVLAQVPIRSIVIMDKEDAVFAKYKERIESTSNMVLPNCEFPKVAIVYRSNGVYPCIVFQPNEEILKAIEEGRKDATNPFEM